MLCMPLTTLKHTCRPYTKLQQEDNVLSHFSDHVWVEAPYVLNETHASWKALRDGRVAAGELKLE